MSGHNKWSTIKYKKGKADAARAKVFTQISKEIFVAVRQAGPDPAANFRLRLCVQKAKAANMPMDNVNRAIQKAAGNIEGVAYEEIVYEGYGAGGVAIMCELLTDNRNRVASDVRYIFSRNNGNLGETGCVSYMFERKGRMTVPAESVDPDELMLAALDAGAEDVIPDEEQIEIITAPDELETVKNAVEEAGFITETAEITMIPANTIEITDEETAQKVLTLLGKLEDYDDIQNVYSNADIPEELIEKLDI
ncbi:MAG TPA: YebC/PmpR family DNA-binding transcriptional regulator [Candidatus Avidehalobacter gallistercoris]|uniref:Probable transcriptional regulatory protein IAB00_06845 n=1 Tax=Candidatus Avidehalobacter gallistercoris TaxID=2840694 RepID=A0A9D1KZY5_9FIRM|nr:YebC/PmpR family DNA-binding transcriptional regulator [Candidatus Avidehalobacter gallistercoris]